MKVSEPPLNNKELERLERDTFKYFTHEMNPENGLVPDNTRRMRRVRSLRWASLSLLILSGSSENI
jgi:hypothetical protein